MIKVAWLARLSQTGDHEDLLRRWNEDHAKLMLQVPGLERYTHNVALEIAEGPGARKEEPAIDGIVCTWWTDADAFDAALKSPEWRRVLEHGREIFEPDWPRAGQAVEIEERIMRIGPGTQWTEADVPAGMAKHAGVLYFRPDLTRDAARSWWTEKHGAIALKIPGIKYYVQSHAVRPLRIDDQEPDGSFPFDGFSEAWLADIDSFWEAHNSPAWDDLQADSPNVFDVARLEAGVNVVVDEQVLKG